MTDMMAAAQAQMERAASFYDQIMEQAQTDPLGAAQLLCEGLMRGDSDSLKMGYSIGSALIATLEQVPLTANQIGALVERVAVPKPGIVDLGPVGDPQVYVNVSGGIAEATVTRGEVDVIHVDWDNFRDGDASLLDLEDARDEIERVADTEYRARLLDDITELIEGHPDYEAPTLGLDA
jgi:hypothetical protein